MKKYALYSLFIAVGLLAGYFIFGKSDESAGSNEATELSGRHQHSEAHAGTGDKTSGQLWTCAMHPQIMRPESGDCPMCGMSLIPSEIDKEGLGINEVKMSKNAMALANVQTTVVGNRNGDTDTYVMLSGKIMENGDNIAIQPAHFDGRVERLYVKSIGEKVRKGQTVATVYSPSLVAAQQELITAFRNKEDQPQLYKAVRNKFKNWMIHGNVLNNIERTGEVVSNFPIYSHVSGVITDIAINEGAHIIDGMPIFKISDLNSVWAEFDAYENQIVQFEVGQAISIASDAYPDALFDATVSFIDPILDADTRTVTVRAVLANKKGIFKPGMFVKGNILKKANFASEQINVPASAVLWTGERSLVYLKVDSKQPVFEMRKVTLGTRNGNFYTVIAGLQNGDEIVTNGTFTVDAAAQLQGKKSMMNQDH